MNKLKAIKKRMNGFIPDPLDKAVYAMYNDNVWLIKRVDELESAVQYAYEWSLKMTPKLRPYDLCDRMKEALSHNGYKSKISSRRDKK